MTSLNPPESTPAATGSSRFPSEPASIEEARREILENARIAVEEDPVVEWLTSREALNGRLWMKALRLSGGRLDVFLALMNGERVPTSSLDPVWRSAYGL